MENRGVKRIFLESIVEERLKKIRNELFVIKVKNDSDDSEEEIIQEINEDCLKDGHDLIKLQDNGKNDIDECKDNRRENAKNNEDADNNGKKEREDKSVDDICIKSIGMIKEEPIEKLVVQRPIGARGEHMYCPIVIPDDDIDYSIEEHGIEMVHVPYQAPEVVNIESSDDEVIITHVEHGSMTEKNNQKSNNTDRESFDVEGTTVGGNSSNSGKKNIGSRDNSDFGHCQTKENKDDQKSSPCRLKNNFESPYKELTIPQALSILGCKHYMQDLDQQREEVSQQREEVSQQREEVSRQREDVSQQREEVSQQREEVSQQRIEVSQQREEVSQQREEVSGLVEPEYTERKKLPAYLGIVKHKFNSKKRSNCMNGVEKEKDNTENEVDKAYKSECAQDELKSDSSSSLIETRQMNEKESAKNSNSIPAEIEAISSITNAQISENVHGNDAETIRTKVMEDICRSNTRSSTFLEENNEDIIELDPIETINKAFESPCNKKNNTSRDNSTAFKHPSVRNLSSGERLRTITSKCYSPIRYLSTESSADKRGDYLSSAYQRRFYARETDEGYHYNKGGNYTWHIQKKKKKKKRRYTHEELYRKFTLSVTLHKSASRPKVNRSSGDAALISPLKRFVEMKPNICEDRKDFEKFDKENKKPLSDNDINIPQETLFPIPVAKTVRSDAEQLKDSKKFQPYIVPLKEVHFSGNNTKTHEPLGSDNSDNSVGTMSCPSQSGYEFDSFTQDGQKQYGITHADGEHRNTTSVHPRQEHLSEEDGELVPCKIMEEFKSERKGFISCDDCGHECLSREFMMRHFKLTFHKSATHYKMNVIGLYENKENFVVNKIRPFDELVHICPISRCDRVFLCRADCITHYQKDHLKSDMVYCTANIQKEELCHIRSFWSMLECKVCGNMFADGLNLECHSQTTLHQLYHKYEGMFRIFVCHGCHQFFTSFIPAVDHKCWKRKSSYIALRLLHVSKQRQTMWVIDHASKAAMVKVEVKKEINP